MSVRKTIRLSITLLLLIGLLLTTGVALAQPAAQGGSDPAFELKDPKNDPHYGDTKEGGQPQTQSSTLTLPNRSAALLGAPATPPLCPATTAFTFSDAPTAPIQDKLSTSVNIVVSGAGPYLWDLDLTTFIRHTFASDLDITLMSPAGTVVAISTDNGGGNDDVFNGTLWDDSASVAATDFSYTNLVTSSPLVPEGALAAFVGEDPNGAWTLNIYDDAGGDIGTLDQWSLDVTTLPSAPFSNTASGADSPALAIPDGPGGLVSANILASGLSSFITDVNLITFIRHTFAADLEITLTSPAGTVIVITTDNGGGNNDVFNGTLWDDDAPTPATDNTYINLVVATPLAPEGALAAFIGENPNGVWTLTLGDDASIDTGTLDQWSLGITTGSCGQLFGWAFLDENGDGVRQNSEQPGLAGIPVTLNGPSTDAALSVGADGWYQMTGLVVGNYCVEATIPGGFFPTSPTQVCFAASKAPDTVVNFGVQPADAAIGDFIWHDSNGDGVQDPLELGIEGVAVALWSESAGAPEAVLATTATDDTGHYLFEGLMPGSYFVQVTDEDDVLGDYGLTVGPESQVNPVGPIAVVQHETYEAADFGYALDCLDSEAALGGRVWTDANGDGLVDVAEAGFADVDICAHGISAFFGRRCATTDLHGFYEMCIRTKPPTHWVAPYDIPNSPLSGLAPTIIQVRSPIVVHPGDVVMDVNFGYR